MSIYSNVTEQDLNNLRKLAEQQKEQRALKIKNGTIKQTHDRKIAESLSRITEKLEEVKKSTKKLGDVMKETNSENENNQEIVPVEIDSEGDITNLKIKALPNSFVFSDLRTNTLERLISGPNSLRIKSSPSGASILGVPIYTLVGDKSRICDNDYELNPEIYKALSHTGYTGNTKMNENDILMMNNINKRFG